MATKKEAVITNICRELTRTLVETAGGAEKVVVRSAHGRTPTKIFGLCLLIELLTRSSRVTASELRKYLTTLEHSQ